MASLRVGAATQMYRDGVELSKIQWAGRWRSSRTLEIYIQEVAALNVLAELDFAQRHKFRWYAASFLKICGYVVEALDRNMFLACASSPPLGVKISCLSGLSLVISMVPALKAQMLWAELSCSYGTRSLRLESFSMDVLAVPCL